jgi:hypothetical protein
MSTRLRLGSWPLFFCYIHFLSAARNTMPLPFRVCLVSLAIAACAAAIAVAPPKAAAPRLAGFGDVHWAIASRMPAAQALFDQGLQQAYAFDEGEAVRAFKAALDADPACTMCAWGAAWQLGPNYNHPRSGDYAEARRYALQAQQMLSNADAPLVRELVAAMVARYGAATGVAAVAAANAAAMCGSAANAKADPLDAAYAGQLRALADAYPAEPDVQSLYAEAVLIANPGPGYDTATQQTLPRTRALIKRIEEALQKHPRHTGLIHYLTHAADTPADAARASLAGGALAQLAPNAPHLVHMPSHLYFRVGRYADAVRANQRALDAQLRLVQTLEQQGFTLQANWNGHNRRYLWTAAQVQGDSQESMRIAREMAEAIGARNDDLGRFVRSMPLLTMVQFEQWANVLDATAAAADTATLAPNFVAHARALALLRSGRAAEAGADIRKLAQQHAAANAKAAASKDEKALAALLLAHAKAEQALAKGTAKGAKTAAAELQRMIAAAPVFGEQELPVTGASPQRMLGEALLRLRDDSGAEAAFRTDLLHLPGNVWALRGLHQALLAQGRKDDAAQVLREWRASAVFADPPLRPQG